MFFAMSAYIFRIDEGLQFCIKAIQDFACSGFAVEAASMVTSSGTMSHTPSSTT